VLQTNLSVTFQHVATLLQLLTALLLSLRATFLSILDFTPLTDFRLQTLHVMMEPKKRRSYVIFSLLVMFLAQQSPASATDEMLPSDDGRRRLYLLNL